MQQDDLRNQLLQTILPVVISTIDEKLLPHIEQYLSIPDHSGSIKLNTGAADRLKQVISDEIVTLDE